jgi:hypothetical protein
MCSLRTYYLLFFVFAVFYTSGIGSFDDLTDFVRVSSAQDFLWTSRNPSPIPDGGRYPM